MKVILELLYTDFGYPVRLYADFVFDVSISVILSRLGTITMLEESTGCIVALSFHKVNCSFAAKKQPGKTAVLPLTLPPEVSKATSNLVKLTSSTHSTSQPPLQCSPDVSQSGAPAWQLHACPLLLHEASRRLPSPPLQRKTPSLLLRCLGWMGLTRVLLYVQL